MEVTTFKMDKPNQRPKDLQYLSGMVQHKNLKRKDSEKKGINPRKMPFCCWHTLMEINKFGLEWLL